MNLLILSYVYAPDRSPRAYRWTTLAEYWARQGHRIDVVSGWKQGDSRLERRNGVTVHRVGGGLIERLRAMLGQSSHRIVDTPASTDTARGTFRRAIRSLYSATLKKLFWPDYAFYWFPAAFARGRSLCRAIPYDAVISVSHPFTPHLVGLALKRHAPATRWIIDIGDPFSLLNEIPLNNPVLYRRLNRRAESTILGDGDAVTVTVERCRADFIAAFPKSTDKITVIPPLLSLPKDIDPSAPLLSEDRTHLVFIGTLYRALRDPSYLLALFQALQRRRHDLHLHFYGALNDCAPCFSSIDEAVAGNIHRHGMASREMVARAMRDADILVNIGNATPHQLPSKLVEYAAAAKPILNIATTLDDTAADFLAAYPAALTIFTGGPEPVQTAIDAALAFIAAPPSIAPAAVACFLRPYTLERIADAYAVLVVPPATA